MLGVLLQYLVRLLPVAIEKREVDVSLSNCSDQKELRLPVTRTPGDIFFQVASQTFAQIQQLHERRLAVVLKNNLKLIRHEVSYVFNRLDNRDKRVAFDLAVGDKETVLLILGFLEFFEDAIQWRVWR